MFGDRQQVAGLGGVTIVGIIVGEPSDTIPSKPFHIVRQDGRRWRPLGCARVSAGRPREPERQHATEQLGGPAGAGGSRGSVKSTVSGTPFDTPKTEWSHHVSVVGDVLCTGVIF
jgi:hypothetical protein